MFNICSFPKSRKNEVQKQVGYCWLKIKCTTWELWVKFYLGQNEGCSPRGSISDSSERLLRGVSGGKSICILILVKGEFNTMQHSFLKGFLLVMRIWCHHEGIYCFSRYEEIQGLRSQTLFLKTSNCLKTCSTRFPEAQSASLHPESPQGLLKVNSQAAWGSISVEADDKCICCSVVGSALGKCQFVVDGIDP